MNLKRTLGRALVVAGLVGAVSAPAALAQVSETNTADNNKSAVVTVNTPGVFNVYFTSSGTDLNLGTANLVAGAATDTKTGQVSVEYTDTMAYRPYVGITMTATDFIGQTNSSSNTIANTNFTITSVGTVSQGLAPGGNPAVTDFTESVSVNTPLSTGLLIHDASAGSGAVWASGAVNLSLFIPHTTAADNYKSTMTLTVSPASP